MSALKKSVASVRQDAVLGTSSVLSEETDHTERTCLFTECDSKFCPLGLLTIAEGEAMVERGSRLRPHVPEEPDFILSTAVTAKVFAFAIEVENMVRHVPICLRIINLEKRIQVFLIKKVLQPGVGTHKQHI